MDTDDQQFLTSIIGEITEGYCNHTIPLGFMETQKLNININSFTNIIEEFNNQELENSQSESYENEAEREYNEL